MSDQLSDQELKKLFQSQLPPVELPATFAADLRRQVMADVATTLRQSDTETAWNGDRVTPGAVVPRPARRAQPQPRASWVDSLTRWLGGLRLLPSLAVAGATIALLVVFVRYGPGMLDSLGTPSVQTGVSPDGAPILQPITGTMTADVTIIDGTATLVKANGRTEDLVPTSTTTMAPGDSLLTLTASARVDYFASQYSIMQPGTRMELLELNDGNGGTQVTTMVHLGSTRHFIEDPLDNNDRFEVWTPSSYASAVGTEFVVEVRSADESFYATLSGVVLVNMGSERVTVSAGEQLTAVSGENLVVEASDPSEVAMNVATPTEPAPEPTATATETATPAPTNTPEPTATNTPLPTATATNTAVPTATNTPQPTATNTAEPTATATNTTAPTATNTAQPTATNTPLPTATATPAPTATPTDVPVVILPTATPTETPIPVEVKLAWPNDRVSGSGDQLFRWTTNVMPAEGQAFELIFWREGQDPLAQGFGLAEPTRSTSVTVDLTKEDDRLGALLDPGEYYWGVRLVETDPYARIDFVSDSRLFRYSGSQSGISGPINSGE